MPHDYLGCNCCKGLDSALAPSQPPTAVLYQLYLECGAIINAADLWTAFYAVMGNEESENEEADRERVLWVFFFIGFFVIIASSFFVQPVHRRVLRIISIRRVLRC